MKIGRLTKTMLIYFIGNISTKLISFILIPIYTLYLKAEALGYYDYILTVVVVLVPIFFQSIADAVLRFGIDAEDDEQQKKVFSTVLIYLAALTTVYVAISLVIMPFVEQKYLVYILLMFIGQLAMSVWHAAARALNLTSIYMMSNVASVLCSGTSNIILIIVFGLQAESLMISYIIACFVSVFVIEVRAKLSRKVNIKYFDKTLLKSMLYYSVPLIISTTSWQLLTLANRILIPFKLGMEANGIYAIASRLTVVLVMLTSVFTMAWQEELIRRGNKEDQSKYFNEVFDTLMRFSLTGAIVILPATKIMFPLLIHGNYATASSLMPALYLANVFSVFSSHTASVFLMNKDTVKIVISTATSAVVSIGMMWFLSDIFGLPAVAASALISFVYRWCLCVAMAKKDIKINFDIKTTLMLIIVYGVVSYIYLRMSMTANAVTLLFALLGAIYVNRLFLHKKILNIKSNFAKKI